MSDIMDGFLHAIAVGPTTLHPKQWLPKIWGTEDMMPPMDSIEELNHMLGLVMRHFNSIIAGLEADPREIGEDDFSVDQDELSKTPAMRAELALEIPQAILDMHAHWLPLRLAVYERQVAKSMQPKVGRNEPCPCGSGMKFKKCSGAAAAGVQLACCLGRSAGRVCEQTDRRTLAIVARAIGHLCPYIALGLGAPAWLLEYLQLGLVAEDQGRVQQFVSHQVDDRLCCLRKVLMAPRMRLYCLAWA